MNGTALVESLPHIAVWGSRGFPTTLRFVRRIPVALLLVKQEIATFVGLSSICLCGSIPTTTYNVKAHCPSIAPGETRRVFSVAEPRGVSGPKILTALLPKKLQRGKWPGTLRSHRDQFNRALDEVQGRTKPEYLLEAPLLPMTEGRAVWLL